MTPIPHILPVQHTDCFLFPDDPARRERGQHSIMSSQNYNYKKHRQRQSCRESPDRYKNSARATHSISHRTKKIYDESPAASQVQNRSRVLSSNSSQQCRSRRRRGEKKSKRLSPEGERSSQRKSELRRRSLLAGIEFIGKSLLSKKDENTSNEILLVKYLSYNHYSITYQDSKNLCFTCSDFMFRHNILFNICKRIYSRQLLQYL